ncbi:hypothetical protein [Nonomuraea sp. NPDC049725]|uniref:hypothetical protein n=1 Tax=Nonomuraea sp. NPDC049725 TaxID=3154508 RepID=UPI00343398E0
MRISSVSTSGPIEVTAISTRSPGATSSVAPGPSPFTVSSSHGPVVANVRPSRIASA